MQNAGPRAISSLMPMASLGSLLELRALLDVLESRRAPERSVLRVKSKKTGFELAEANSHRAGSRRATKRSPHSPSSARYGRSQRSTPSTEEDDSPDLMFSTT
jgi:hypothetical protein